MTVATTQEAYAIRRAELLALIAELSACVPAQETAPHWGHIGDLCRAIGEAKNLRAVMTGTDA